MGSTGDEVFFFFFSENFFGFVHHEEKVGVFCNRLKEKKEVSVFDGDGFALSPLLSDELFHGYGELMRGEFPAESFFSKKGEKGVV